MKYLPVRINTLRPGASVNFDVYLQLGDRYIHYIRDQDPLEESRIKKLKEKKVRKLFIQVESEPKYLEYLDAGLSELSQSNKPEEEKGGIANDSMVTAAENAERNLETEKGYQMTEDHFKKIVTFIQSDRGAIKSILSSAGTSEDNHQHAATVSSLSLSVASKLGVKGNKELVELGIAGLVHDIGKNSLPFDPLKLQSELTDDERKQYEAHVTNSLEILTPKKFITPNIIHLVANHEEIGRGRGFPEKKHLSKLPKLNQILNLCNDFDRFCYGNKLEPLKGIDPFYEARADNFNEEHIAILATVLT